MQDLSDAAVKLADLPPPKRSADELNDIRLALGALSNSHRDLRQRLESVVDGLDDVGALMHRVVAFSTFLDDIEAFGERIPALLRGLADDPMIGMFAAGPATKLADEWETFMAQRADQRANPPAIEG